MALPGSLPQDVENRLRELTARRNWRQDGAAAEPPADSDGPRIVFAADLDASGAFGQEWLVVEAGQLYVFGAPRAGANGNGHSAAAETRFAIPLSEVREARADVRVGNGVIEARVGPETIPLVRFSQATAAEAHTVVRHINALARGEPVVQSETEAFRRRCPRCNRVLAEHTSVCPACIDKRAVMIRLFRFVAPYKLQVAGTVIILGVMTLADIAPPYIGKVIVDTLVYPRRYNPGHSLLPIVWLVLILAGVQVLMAVLKYGQRRLNPWLGARTLMDIRISLYNKFNELSLAYYDKRTVGSVMARVTNDADNLWDFLSEGAPWFVSNVLTLLAIGTVLFRLNAQLALLVVTPAPFIYMLTRWFLPRARRKWHHVWHRISRMYSALGASLNGMRVVKAFAQEQREIRRFGHSNYAVFEASFAANAFWASYWPLIGLLMSAGGYIIWLFGGYKVLQGAMTIGTLTAFNAYLVQFYMPFQNFSRVLDWTTRSLTAAERVFEVLDTQPDVTEAADPVPIPHMQGAVEFDNVGFAYDKGKRVIDGLTLRVEPGEMIGLVGHSGAGKSTIINLLARFYDVDEGAIRVDGVDVRNIKLDDFRHQLGIVLQEPFLFPGTLRENIAYAKPGATVEEVMRAAKAANCHEFIMKFPDGYDSPAGERGQRLSGGERQRISIARAILHDPRILILDEATASVDTETEQQIQTAINRLVQSRTTFAIAHRLNTLRHADRLVVMKEGKMVECGSHDELVAKDGVYAGLVRVQTEVNRIRAI